MKREFGSRIKEEGILTYKIRESGIFMIIVMTWE